MPVTCPVSTIVKQRMQHGKECFEVSWEGVNVLRTSIVAADLVERYYSHSYILVCLTVFSVA